MDNSKLLNTLQTDIANLKQSVESQAKIIDNLKATSTTQLHIINNLQSTIQQLQLSSEPKNNINSNEEEEENKLETTENIINSENVKNVIDENYNNVANVSNQPFKFNKNKMNSDLFKVSKDGQTLKMKVSDVYGTIMFGECSPISSNVTYTVIFNLKKIATGFCAFGFCTPEFVQFATNDEQNEGENHSCVLYCDGDYYTSEDEFANNSYVHGYGIKSMEGWAKKGDNIAVEMNLKVNKGRIWNMDNDDGNVFEIEFLKCEKVGIIVTMGFSKGKSLFVVSQTVK